MAGKPRRIVAAASALAFLAAACGGGGDDAGDGASDGAASESGEGRTLVVANWNDYGSDMPWAVEEFEERTGATVVHQYFNSQEEMLAMLRSGGVGEVDLILPNLAYIGQAIDEGLVQPVDLSQLENVGDLYPQFVEEEGLTRDGETYGVPWVWGSTSLAYNSEEITEELDSWDALWDPAYAGRVAFFDDAPTAIQTAALYAGEDPQDPDLDAVREALLELKPATQVYWSSADDWTRGFSAGSVVIGNLWSGLAGTQVAAGDPVTYTIPQEGAPGWLDSWAIVDQAPNEDLAYEFIDWMTSEEFQLRWAQDEDRSSPAPANSLVHEQLDEATAERIQSDPAAIEQLAMQRDIDQETLTAWTQLWQEVKAS